MIALLFLIFSGKTFASTSDARFELLIGAKSKAEVRAAIDQGAQIETLKEQCAQEIELRDVPKSCFRESKLEFDRKRMSEHEFEIKTHSLNGFCRRAARESHNISQLKAALNDELSSSCRTTVQSRVDDLSYQIGEVRELDRFLN